MDRYIEDKSWNHRVVTIPIMIFFTMLLLWISLTKIDEMVVGQGSIVPSSNNKIIQHLEGGIIKAIYVHEGDRVKKGQPLFKVSNSFYISDAKQKKIELENLNNKKKRLQAQLAFKNSLKLDTKNSFVQNEINIFNSEMKQYTEKMSLNQNELDQLKLEKKQKLQKIKNLKLEMQIATENLNMLKKLLKGGAASKKQYLAELSKKQSLITQIADLTTEIPIINQKIKKAFTKIDSFKSETKTKWLKELNKVEVKIASLEQTEIASTDREKRQSILSPVNGIIKKLYFTTIGGVIKAGDKIAEITPLDDSLVIEAKIKTSDRGDLVIGQDVSIQISAYSYSKYGYLQGKLIYISPDSFTTNKGFSYYTVKVKADKYEVAKGKELLPGMMATIHIKTGKKTILSYILKPLKDIKQNALIEK